MSQYNAETTYPIKILADEGDSDMSFAISPVDSLQLARNLRGEGVGSACDAAVMLAAVTAATAAEVGAGGAPGRRAGGSASARASGREGGRAWGRARGWVGDPAAWQARRRVSEQAGEWAGE